MSGPRGVVRAGAPVWGPDSDMEACAAALSRRRDVSGGVAFARTGGDRPEKRAARAAALALFTPGARPGRLKILTMPGLSWRFERALLSSRVPAGDAGGHRLVAAAAVTEVHAVEAEPAVFVASLRNVPGRTLTLRVEAPPAWAVARVSSRAVASYTCARAEAWLERAPEAAALDAAWVDLTGPPGARLLHLLRELWAGTRVGTLVLTGLNARWSAEVGARVARAGGMLPMLRGLLAPCEVAHELTYADGAPMFQIAVTRPGRTPGAGAEGDR